MEILEDISYWTAHGWAIAILIILLVIAGAFVCCIIEERNPKVCIYLCFTAIAFVAVWTMILMFGWCGTSYHQEKYVIRVNEETTVNELYEKWEIYRKYDYTNVYEVYPKEDRK